MAQARSGRGIGVIEYPKDSGKWWALAKHHGKQHWRRAANKSHARDLYQEMKVAIRKGEFPPKPVAKVPRFDELLEEYREAKRREGNAIMASDVGFRRLLERFGDRSADKIAVDEVERWRDEMLETMAPASVNLHLCLLRAILRRAVRGKRLDAAMVPEVKGLKANNTRVRYLTDGEEEHLMEALPEYLRPLVTIAIHTGMRKGELLNLQWSDLDFVTGTIHVREAKSGEGRRLPMNPVAHKTLAVMRDRRRDRLRARVVDRNAANMRVFTGPRDGGLMNLGRDWYPALKRIGLEGLHFHDLRHTFASRLVMAGVDLYRVQTLLGHKTAAMTMRYAHLSPAHLRAAVDLLAASGPKPWAAERE